MLIAEKLSKKYGDFSAVQNLSFEVKKGSIFGFLGHNGAGKTTTISMLTTLILPTSGKASIGGYDIVKDNLKVRNMLGYLPESVSLYGDLTAVENLRFFGKLSGVENVNANIEETLHMLDFTEWKNCKVKTYSKGMRQSIGIAQAILHKPKILFLDEPTSGLDPQGTKDMRDILLKLNTEWGTTIFMNTHLLSEVTKLCTDIGILSVIFVYIGSSTKNAEIQAYQDIVQLLKTQGATRFPSPPEIFPLSFLRNIINYVSMIGAVVAIFLGFETFSGERNNGTLRLIAVRPVYRDQIVTGKLLGGGMVIGLLLGIILVFNLVLFVMVSGLHPNMNEIGRFFIFFVLAFVYMMSFYIVTLLVSLKTNDSAFGFMLLMIIWITISFVLPQLADSQRSFAYALNSTAQTVTQVPSDTVVSKTIELFSPAAQFQNIGKDLLQVVPETATVGIIGIIQKQIGAVIDILLPGLALLLLTYKTAQKEEVV